MPCSMRPLRCLQIHSKPSDRSLLTWAPKATSDHCRRAPATCSLWSSALPVPSHLILMPDVFCNKDITTSKIGASTANSLGKNSNVWCSSDQDNTTRTSTVWICQPELQKNSCSPASIIFLSTLLVCRQSYACRKAQLLALHISRRRCNNYQRRKNSFSKITLQRVMQPGRELHSQGKNSSRPKAAVSWDSTQPFQKSITAEVKPVNIQKKNSQSGRQSLGSNSLFLSGSIKPSWQDQKETQKAEAAWDPVGKGWIWRPFLLPAAAYPGEKPSGLTFRGHLLVSTSHWSCFGQSPSLSSPGCGRKVQGVLAAGSSLAPPSAQHSGSLSSKRICCPRAASDSNLLRVDTRVGEGPSAWSTSPVSPGQPSLCSSPLPSGIPARQVFLFFYAPVLIPCPFPPLLSIPTYIAQRQQFVL